MRLHDAPDYYVSFVLQVRGIFLRTSLHHVVHQQVALGRGIPQAASRFATGLAGDDLFGNWAGA